MEFEMSPYIVYVKVNSDGYVMAVNSSEFLSDTTDWIEINQGYGDKYHHAQGNYFDKPIYTDGGAYRYRLVGKKVVECSAEDIEAQEKANMPEEIPSQLDVIEAQVTYTAMMTDTLLEV